MDSNIKILIGVLVVIIVVIGGLFIWISEQPINKSCGNLNEEECIKNPKCEPVYIYPIVGGKQYVGCREKYTEPVAKQVTLTTDKTEYRKGEIVKISVINIDQEEISLCNYPTLESPVFYVEKFENGTWITVCCVGACRCHSPCMVRIKRCWEIQPNQTLEFKWYQKKETCKNSQYTSIQAEPGKYRIRFNIGTSLNPIYSNEFTIK